MPRRITPLITGEYYHIYNRGVNKASIFFNTKDYRRAIDILSYYFFANVPMKYSDFINLPTGVRNDLWQRLSNSNERLVDLICYCLMPNHYHFLVRQRQDQGLSRFIANWQDSHAKYINTRTDRSGPLFQGPFRSVRIETDEQLLHLSRYIHLNPYTAMLVRNEDAVLHFPWSSIGEYLGISHYKLCVFDVILSQMPSRNSYRDFILDRGLSQKSLAKVKHLALE